jgi:hypothetical protein
MLVLHRALLWGPLSHSQTIEQLGQDVPGRPADLDRSLEVIVALQRQ